MENLSFARIMYGTSEDYRRGEANYPGASLTRSAAPAAGNALQELLRKVWLTITAKH